MTELTRTTTGADTLQDLAQIAFSQTPNVLALGRLNPDTASIASQAYGRETLSILTLNAREAMSGLTTTGASVLEAKNYEGKSFDELPVRRTVSEAHDQLYEYYVSPYRRTFARAQRDEEDLFMLLVFAETLGVPKKVATALIYVPVI